MFICENKSRVTTKGIWKYSHLSRKLECIHLSEIIVQENENIMSEDVVAQCVGVWLYTRRSDEDVGSPPGEWVVFIYSFWSFSVW